MLTTPDLIFLSGKILQQQAVLYVSLSFTYISPKKLSYLLEGNAPFDIVCLGLRASITLRMRYEIKVFRRSEESINV